MSACTFTTLPTHSDSCAAWAIFRPIKSFHSLSLRIMSLSHHSTKLGTIHMSHRLIPLISTLFHPLQCSFTHFLNNSKFFTSFYLCYHSLMLDHYNLLPEPLLAFLYSYCMTVRRNHLCIPAMHTSVQRHQVLTRYKFPITSSLIQDLAFSSFSHTQTIAVQKY